LNYNSEVWGFVNAEVLERVQRKFCKWLINVKRSTNTLSLYSELGRFPLFIERHIRMVKYFLKLHGIKRENCILNAVLMEELKDLSDNPQVINWISRIKSILEPAGFAEVWLFPESVCVKGFVPVLRNRLRDIYITGWRASIDTHTSLYLYKEIKSTFQMSPYITLLQNIKYRNILAKLRLSSHNLQIESGRHYKIPRHDRKCILCNLNDIEDEFHFVLICPFYSDLRAQLIP